MERINLRHLESSRSTRQRLRLMASGATLALLSASFIYAADPPVGIPDFDTRPLASLPDIGPASRPALTPQAAMKEAFSDLAAAEASVRESARVRLMGMTQGDLEPFRDLVQKSLPLAPAQANALREIVLHVYAAGIKPEGSTRDGFLGVRLGEINVASINEKTDDNAAPNGQPQGGLFGQQARSGPATTGVVILERMTGFCGARMFLDGDIVLSIVIGGEHLPVRNPTEMRNSVMQYGAGQTVEFGILRQGRIVQVSVVLDPRPDVADPLVNGMQKLLDDRKSAAEEYWNKAFGGLLREKIG